MADEPNDAVAEEEKGAGGGLIFRIAILAVVIIIPIVAAFITFKLVIEPSMSKDVPAPIENTQGPADPTLIVNHEFEQQLTDLTPSNPEYPAATLAYQVGFECQDPATQALIMQHQGRFQAIITDKHRHHTREEANERLLQKSIEQQILIEANALLERYNPNPEVPLKVLDVYHIAWLIHE